MSATCPHFGLCGGCIYQDIPYEEQLRQKEQMVRELLLPTVKDDPVWEGIVPSPAVHGYRNKMEFSFGDEYKDGPLSLGLHRRKSMYDIITVDQCNIVDGDYRMILRAVLDYFTAAGIPYYHKRTRQGALRHLVIRKAAKTGEILVMLVTTSAYAPGEDFARMLLELPVEGSYAGILHAVNDLPADTVQSDDVRVLYGRDHFYEELLGLKFKITPFSFFQTNSLGAEKLYDTVRGFAGQNLGTEIYDLYSGTGTIAQLLAPVAGHVTGVEIVEEAVEAARLNAAENGLTNCSFIAGDVLKVLDSLPDSPDFIVLDPPREGINPRALGKILRYGVRNIVYVSCNPKSLARDMEPLYSVGYRCRRVRLVDMFPFTKHVEAVSLLQRMSNTRERTITLDVEMEDYHRIKNGGE